MSTTNYAFIMNSENLYPAICSGELFTGEFHAKIVAVHSMEMAKEEANRFSQEGYAAIDLCGDFDEAAAAEISQVAGESVVVSFMTYLPAELEKLSALSSMNHYGILLLHPSFIGQKDRFVLKSLEFDTYVIGAGSLDEAKILIRELVEDGIDFIELASQFTKDMANELIAELGGKVPVGFAGK